MIIVRTALAECVMVGEDNNTNLPSQEQIDAHIERVEARACGHYAVTVNSTVLLHSCPACSS